MTRLLPSPPDLLIFGGGFDPPHVGHLVCLTAAHQRFPSAELWMVPAKVVPSASGTPTKTARASFGDRLEMCRLALGSLEADASAFSVSDIEGGLPTPSYTVNLVEHLSRQHPQRRLGLIIGQDQWSSFGRWHHPRRILELSDLVVIDRVPLSPSQEGPTSQAVLVDLSRTLGLETERTPEGAQGLTVLNNGRAIYFVGPPPPGFQSRIIRDEIMRSGHAATDGLPRGVLKYINENRIYQEA